MEQMLLSLRNADDEHRQSQRSDPGFTTISLVNDWRLVMLARFRDPVVALLGRHAPSHATQSYQRYQRH
jgi:hypothetical protein